MLYKYALWQENDEANEDYKNSKAKEVNFTKKNIQDSTLYFNTSANFNDPFDGSPSYNVSPKSREELLKCFSEENYGKFDATLIAEACKISGSEFNGIFKNSDYDRFYTARRGITCFSKDNANILMWSHYASNHKGVCLGFDIDEQDEHLEKFFDEDKNRHLFPHNKACRLFPMTYVSFDKRPSIDMTNENESFLNILTFKSDLWEYEKEVRIMVHSYDQIIFPCILHYQPDRLKEIICGANMSLKTFIKLKEFVEELPYDNKISIYIATLSEIDYKLDIKKLDTTALQMISRSYHGLRSIDKIFTLHAINELMERHEISEQNIKNYWSNSLENIPIHRAISDFQFDKIEIADMVQKGGDASADIHCPQDLVLSLFIDSMAKDMRYLILK